MNASEYWINLQSRPDVSIFNSFQGHVFCCLFQVLSCRFYWVLLTDQVLCALFVYPLERSKLG